MALRRFARPASAAPQNPIALLPEPTGKVVDVTVFDPAKSYRVRLSAVAEVAGTTLSPMHVHTVTGAVAQAIRAKVAAFGPA